MIFILVGAIIADVILSFCLINVIQKKHELERKLKDKKRYVLMINGGAKDAWAVRKADLISDIKLEKIEIDGQEFWKLSYVEDGLSCEAIESEPIRYSLRLEKVEI